MASRNEELDSAITLSMVLKFFFAPETPGEIGFWIGYENQNRAGR